MGPHDVGQHVRHTAWQWTGTVLDLRGSMALVAVEIPALAVGSRVGETREGWYSRYDLEVQCSGS